ncbi:MAG: hypothetical protein AAFU59_03390 [Pseudomonadota bacterium]
MKRYLPLALAAALSACTTTDFQGGFTPVSERLGAASDRVVSWTRSLTGTGPQTRRLDTPLPMLARPAKGQFRSFVLSDMRSGVEGPMTFRAKGRRLRVEEPDGCTWRSSLDWFSPSTSWEGCGTSRNWHTGSAQVSVLDPLYPLKIGARGVYERVATSHTGRTYTRQTICRVTGAEQVVRGNGALSPAYVVACDDGKRVRTTWYAPDDGPVAYVQRHAVEGIEDAWVRVR